MCVVCISFLAQSPQNAPKNVAFVVNFVPMPSSPPPIMCGCDLPGLVGDNWEGCRGEMALASQAFVQAFVERGWLSLGLTPNRTEAAARPRRCSRRRGCAPVAGTGAVAARGGGDGGWATTGPISTPPPPPQTTPPPPQTTTKSAHTHYTWHHNKHREFDAPFKCNGAHIIGPQFRDPRQCGTFLATARKQFNET